MELLAPAGNLEKLAAVYRWGADAAYFGLGNFSLRAMSDNFTVDQGPEVHKLKTPGKKLFAALNILFSPADLKRLDQQLQDFAAFPIDAFIISDLGVLRRLQQWYPKAQIHLSTQASCLNADAALVYADLGFSRIILGREASLRDLEEIKRRIPHLEVEVFVHGAMCVAYSGRCLLSSDLVGCHRSANKGECTHACRWEFRLLEEKQRTGVNLTLEQGPGYTTILSSRDLCMIDHLQDLKNAGADSIKIEGRMKSVYYAAVVTRAYRSALEKLEGKPQPYYEEFRREIEEVSHREYSTGFFYDKESMNTPNLKDYQVSHTFVGVVGPYAGDGAFELQVRNQIRPGDQLEFLSPDAPTFSDDTYVILDAQGQRAQQYDHMKTYTIRSARPLATGMLIRKKKPEGTQDLV